MQKTFTILIIAILMAIGTVASAQNCNAPVVTSFSPNTGLIGSTVTISGSYFDPVAANNHVMFGATKATVVTANFGTLTVKVPVGATSAPISVRNACNLIAYSSTAFNGIFCPTPINATTYQNTAFTLTGVHGAYNMVAMDIDLDGKPDVISGSNGGGGLTIARNLSTPGNLNFVAHNFAGRGGNSIAVADFDGDGRVDIITPNAIARNISTGPGNVDFQFYPSVGNYQVGAGDFNNDGKIDILYQDGSNNLILRRNTSTGPGVISFVQAFVVNVAHRNNGVQVADVDGDGKVDIMASQGNGNRMVSLRNTTPVNATVFTFESLEAWPSNGVYPYRAMIADFDKDGKIDFTTPNYGHGDSSPLATNTAVFRNTSSVGNITFAPSVNLPAPVYNYRIGVGDVNGDGFPDIVTKSNGLNIFSVYPNVSSGPGNAAFSARIDYSSSAMAEVSGIVIGDLDGDFVPDIATSGISSNTIRFHRNTSAQADVTPPTAISKNITVALSPSGTVTVTPEMVDNGSGDACGIASMTLNDAASLTFTCANIGVNTVMLKVTDKGGNISTNTATITVAPAAIIVAGQSTVCQGQSVALSANLGDSYQWYVNGEEIVGATAQTFSATESGKYTVAVTNAGGCSGTSAATSVTVNNNPTVNILPAGITSLCNGSLTLTASQSSTYQWYLNGNPINGATQRTYNATAGGSYTVSVLDLFGCSATSAAVIVNATDNVAPVAKVKNLTIALDANESASVSVADINNGSSDNCSAVTLAISGTTSFSCAQVGQIIPVTLTVTDDAGNESSAIAQVTVIDPNSYCNAAPVAKAKPLTLSANSVCQANASASEFNDGSTDADGDTLTYSISPAAPFAIGVTTVTLTVTDTKGANSTSVTTVTVKDKTAPVIASASSLSVSTDSGVCGAQVSLATPATSDNCGVASVTNDAPSVFPVGTTTVTWTVTDVNGLTATTTQAVTVTDNEKPVALSKNVSVTLVNGSAFISAASVDAGSSDACGIASLAISKAAFDCSNIGDNTVTLTVTDKNGNVSETTAKVTVIGVKPVPSIAVSRTDNTNTGGDANIIFLGYGAQRLTLTASNATSAATATTYSWSPAAGLSSTTVANPGFTPTAAGTYSYTVVATNEFGCTATSQVTLTVVDAVCGNKGDKVLVCHKGQEICVSPAAVQAHLAHGCKLGSCSTKGATNARIANAIEQEKEAGLVAYPNPVANKTTIEFTVVQEGSFSLELYDIRGALVKIVDKGQSEGNKFKSYELDASAYAEGVYLVKLVTDKQVSTKRIVVDRK